MPKPKTRDFLHSMTPEQCKAARAMTGLSQDQLAQKSGVAVSTIIPFEQKQRNPYASTVEKLRSALETAGIEFIEENGGGAGLRMQK